MTNNDFNNLIKNKTFYIHVGFPKCASTLLQTTVFNNLSDVFFERNNSKSLHKIFEEYYFENFIDEQDIKLKIYNYVKNIKESKIIISWERIIGDIFHNFNNHFLLIKILKIFKNVKIICIIRNQSDFLNSLYSQSLKQGYSINVNDFLNFKNNQFNRFQPFYFNNLNVDIKNLNYWNFYLNYKSNFGKQNILFLPFELLKQDSDLFVKKITQFINTELKNNFSLNTKNKSYSIVSAKLALMFNKFINYKFNNFGFYPEKPLYSFFIKLNRNSKNHKRFFYILANGFGKIFSFRFFLESIIDNFFYLKRSFINKKIKKYIMSIHRKSNKKLSKSLYLDLDKYNYF